MSSFDQSSDNIDIQLENLVNNNKLENFLSSHDELSLVNQIPVIYKIYAEKSKRNYFKYAQIVTDKIIEYVNSWITPYISEILCSILKNPIRSQKEYVYLAFKKLIEINPDNIRICMPKLIPIISSDINDVSNDVKKNAYSVLSKLLKCSGNNDLDVFIPIVLKGIKSPEIIEEAVESLASCVFVQNVEAPALAITMPILARGLKSNKTVTKRKSCIIIDNMCKLIEHPTEILPFFFWDFLPAEASINLFCSTSAPQDPSR